MSRFERQVSTCSIDNAEISGTMHFDSVDATGCTHNKTREISLIKTGAFNLYKI